MDHITIYFEQKEWDIAGITFFLQHFFTIT